MILSNRRGGHEAELRSALTGEGARPSTSKINGGGQECPPYTGDGRLAHGDRTVAGETPGLPLDIQVLYVERVVFYEFSSGFYVFAH